MLKYTSIVSFKIALVGLISFSLIFAPVTNALEFVISGNGSGSDSQVSVQMETRTTVNQINETNIENIVEQNANTRGNSASGNNSDSVNIETGNITSTASISTNANTSYVDVGCCSSTGTNFTITGNGNGSVNTISLNQQKSTNVNINNKAGVVNSVNGQANTGINKTNKNTGGNISISTGSIKIVNDINNDSVNMSSVSIKTGLQGISAVIKENGSNSVNTIKTEIFDDVSVNLIHSANIVNDIVWNVYTGRNEASGNTGGDINIKTGDIELGVFIKNFVNIGGVEIDCCKDIYDPGDDGNGGPSDENKEDKKEESKKEVQGVITSHAAATEAGGPGIIGLSDTSSAEARALIFWLSIFMIALGSKIVCQELFPRHSTQKIG